MWNLNWPEVLAGFGLGLVPLVWRQLYIYIRFTRTPGRRKYIGDWWQYHRSTTYPDRIMERRIAVSYSVLFDRIKIRTYDPGRLTYSGSISHRHGMVRYADLADLASHERLTWYLVDPFADPVPETRGLYLALDLHGLPTAGPMMISRERRMLEEVDMLLEGDVVRSAPITLDGYMSEGAVAEDGPARLP